MVDNVSMSQCCWTVKSETTALFGGFSDKRHIKPDQQPSEKVLLIDPERKSVYQILGKMYFSEGDMDNAFRVYKKMLDHFPDNYVGYYYIGEIYGVKADYDKAEEAFLKTLELAPSLDEARLELVKIYRLTKQDEKIITMFKQILDRNPDNIISAIELGLLYDKKDAVKAESLLSDLGERSLNDPNVIGTVLQYLILQKRADDAIVVLEGMSKGAPESSEISYAAAIVYYEKGNLDLAWLIGCLPADAMAEAIRYASVESFQSVAIVPLLLLPVWPDDSLLAWSVESCESGRSVPVLDVLGLSSTSPSACCSVRLAQSGRRAPGSRTSCA